MFLALTRPLLFFQVEKHCAILFVCILQKQHPGRNKVPSLNLQLCFCVCMFVGALHGTCLLLLCGFLCVPLDQSLPIFMEGYGTTQ